MTKQYIKQIAQSCYKNGQINEENVNAVLPYLKRKDIKVFIKELIRQSQKNTVTVTSAAPLSEKIMSKISTMYPQKNIASEVDPRLILGIRITDNDTVYNANLDDVLQKMVSYVSET